MQTEKKCFIGIDVSKLWIDLSMMMVTGGIKQDMMTHKFDNNVEGFKLLTQWLKSNDVPFNDNTLVVIENTGVVAFD